MRCGIGHAPGAAGRTHSAVFTREADEQFIAARGTADAGEAVAEDAATQVARKLLGDEGRQIAARIALGGFSQERGQVLTDDVVQ